jgi:CheY-like chemotaxis protein
VSEWAEFLKGVAAVGWAIVGFAALFIFRRLAKDRSGPLSKFGVGPSGVTMEFAERKLEQALSPSEQAARASVRFAATRSVARRLQRNSDLLRSAKILWVDDHPENNQSVLELLRGYGAVVDTAKSNSAALTLLDASRYDVVVSDVARDREEPGGKLKGVELAETVYQRWNQPVILYTTHFDPARAPGMSTEDRLLLVQRVDKAVFGRTNRTVELVHLILDMLER